MVTTTQPGPAPTSPPSRRETLLDEGLARDLLDLLAHDTRTRHLTLEVAVHGGVAHVRGETASHEERVLVRRLVRRTADLYAAWDLVTVAGEGELDVADVGCGHTKQVPEAIGVDVLDQPGVDVVADLEQGLPFEDDSLDHVFAIHVLEHVDDLVGVMHELHRVLRPTGVLHVLTPYWRHVNFAADPTHRRPIDVQTFKYFCTPRLGVPAWRPLTVRASVDTVHADLQPLPPGEPLVSHAELARWFA